MGDNAEIDSQEESNPGFEYLEGRDFSPESSQEAWAHISRGRGLERQIPISGRERSEIQTKRGNWIRWCNEGRSHQAPGYLNPVEYRA